jgi:hypothetical protein
MSPRRPITGPLPNRRVQRPSLITRDHQSPGSAQSLPLAAASWWGLGLPVAAVMTGGYLSFRGLGILESFVVLGALALVTGIMVGVLSHQGFRRGLTAQDLLAGSFGRRGAVAPALIIALLQSAAVTVLLWWASDLLVDIIRGAGLWPYERWIGQAGAWAVLIAVTAALTLVGPRVLEGRPLCGLWCRSHCPCSRARSGASLTGCLSGLELECGLDDRRFRWICAALACHAPVCLQCSRSGNPDRFVSESRRRGSLRDRPGVADARACGCGLMDGPKLTGGLTGASGKSGGSVHRWGSGFLSRTRDYCCRGSPGGACRPAHTICEPVAPTLPLPGPTRVHAAVVLGFVLALGSLALVFALDLLDVAADLVLTAGVIVAALAAILAKEWAVMGPKKPHQAPTVRVVPLVALVVAVAVGWVLWTRVSAGWPGRAISSRFWTWRG